LPAAFRNCDALLWASLCLLLPATETALVISCTTGTGTNAAFRYLLPVLALICVWIGFAAVTASKVAHAVLIGLLVWLGINAIIGAPDHLGWQNEVGWECSHVIGKPTLIGDSLDWSQDLARLSNWVRCHSDEGRTLVCVYGFGEGEPYGLFDPSAQPARSPWRNGTYIAISVDVLFDYDANNFIVLSGVNSSIDRELQGTLLALSDFVSVGRSIRIYRINPAAR
jgi:hypothetical protein